MQISSNFYYKDYITKYDAVRFLEEHQDFPVDEKGFNEIADQLVHFREHNRHRVAIELIHDKAIPILKEQSSSSIVRKCQSILPTPDTEKTGVVSASVFRFLSNNFLHLVKYENANMLILNMSSLVKKDPILLDGFVRLENKVLSYQLPRDKQYVESLSAENEALQNFQLANCDLLIEASDGSIPTFTSVFKNTSGWFQAYLSPNMKERQKITEKHLAKYPGLEYIIDFLNFECKTIWAYTRLATENKNKIGEKCINQKPTTSSLDKLPLQELFSLQAFAEYIQDEAIMDVISRYLLASFEKQQKNIKMNYVNQFMEILSDDKRFAPGTQIKKDALAFFARHLDIVQEHPKFSDITLETMKSLIILALKINDEDEESILPALVNSWVKQQPESIHGNLWNELLDHENITDMMQIWLMRG